VGIKRLVYKTEMICTRKWNDTTITTSITFTVLSLRYRYSL